MNVRALFVVLFNLASFAGHAAARELHGTVWLLGSQNTEERTPVVGAQISLKGVGNRVQSAAGVQALPAGGLRGRGRNHAGCGIRPVPGVSSRRWQDQGG
jgi:hypothetical protein